MSNITLGDDVIDSRDVVKAYDDLEAQIDAFHEDRDERIEERDDLREKISQGNSLPADVVRLAEVLDEIESLTESIADARDEQRPWKGLQDELEGYGDWDHGTELVLDEYFTDFTKEMATSCYDIPDTWPHRCIDWEAAAEELKHDYTYAEVDGYKYWIRC
jgi:hypothetical protein